MKLIYTLIFFSLVNIASGSVTLKIGTSGWGNSTTASQNGLIWGVLVSSADNGFSLPTLQTALENFVIPATASPSIPTEIGTSGYYFARGQSNTSSSGPPGFTNGFMNTVQFDLTGPVGTNDGLALLWFDTAGTTSSGSKFGFQDLAFDVPLNGANITSGITSTPGLATNIIAGAIPEPSRMMLLGFGLVGLFYRRRR